MYKENTCMKHLLLYEVCYCAYQYSLCKKLYFSRVSIVTEIIVISKRIAI